MTTDSLRCERTEVDGVLINALIGGVRTEEQPSVILLPGLSISSRYMAPLAAEIARWTHVAAIDFPGFGGSGKPRSVLDIPGLAAATAGWMDATDTKRVILVGNSVGSQVAVDLAARFPNHAAGLVLTGLALGGQRRGVWNQIGRALVDIPREPLALWPMQARDFIAAGPRRVIQTFSLAMSDRIMTQVPNVTAPTLVVEGSRDPLDDPEWNRILVSSLPHGRLTQLVGGTHALPMSKPRELAASIRSFVGDIQRASQGS